MQIIPVLILLLLIGTTLWWSEKMAGTGKLSLVLARKLVHLVAVSSLAFSPLFFDGERKNECNAYCISTLLGEVFIIEKLSFLAFSMYATFFV